MKLILTGTPPKRMLRWTQRALFAAGFFLLAYSAFILVDTRVFQAKENRSFERLLGEQRELRGGTSRATDGLIGRIEITRLGVSAIVIEGTSDAALRRAVGHIAGTALPGERGNVGLSGHRDTFFRPLRNIRRNDMITLTTLLGEYRYRVVSTRVVGPRDVGVLDRSTNEVLTLVTCYPFYFIGAAPERFIVRAERVGDSS